MSDAYKVGISLLMQSNHAQVLGMLSQQLLGVNAKVNQLTGSFKGLKLAIGGALAIYGGEKMFRVLGGMVEHGSKIVHQQEMLRIAGVRNLDVIEATRRAYEVSGRVQTTTISDNIKHLGELRYAFGDMQTASKYIERISQSNAILNSIKGGGHDEVWSMVKALEEKGLTSKPQEFMRYVDVMTKSVEASSGRVTPGMFFNAFKYGRTSMLGWDETFVGQYLPRAIQSFTGGNGGGGGYGGPGNALMSAFAAVVNGKMDQFPAQKFQQLGLVDSIEQVKGGKGIASITGRDLFQKNPYEWVQSFLMPSLAKHGIVRDEKIQEEVSRLFPNRTAGQIMTMFSLQGRYREGANSPWEKDAKLSREALSTLEGFQELMKRDPTMAMQAFQAQWESFKQALGYAAVGPAMMGLQSITNVITKLTQGAFAHPQAVKAVLASFGTLAGLLVGAGGLAILAALGPAGWFIAGLTALAGVLTYLYPMFSKILGWDRPEGLHRGKGGGSASGYLNGFGRSKGLDWDKLSPGKGKPMSWPKTTFGPTGEIIDESTFSVNQPNAFKRLQQYLGGDKVKPHDPLIKPFIELRPPVDRLNRNIERLNQGLEKQGSIGGEGGGLNWPGGATPAMYTGGGISAAPFAGGGMPSVPFGSGTSKAGAVHKQLASLGAPIGSAGGSFSSSANSPMGQAIDASPVPGGVLAMAAKLSGDPGKLQKFMASMGHPKSGAWCGQFAASVVRRAGGTPPKGSALADNWKQYGSPDATPHVGDVAVRSYHVNGHGHVGFVTKVNRDGSFVMEGGNQGGHTFMNRRGGYLFRRPPNDVLNKLTGSGASEQTGAIPPPAKNDIHIHHSSILDGRVVARSTMKHIVGMGNGPARAPRLHDPLSTGPITV